MEAAMHHPVCLAFYMDHLGSEDQRPVRRWSARIAGVSCSLALLLFAAMAVGNQHPGTLERDDMTGMSQVARLVGLSSAFAAEPAGIAPDTPRAKWFTPACARQDLRALSIIEERGEDAGAPAERLADAGLRFLQARLLCLSGHEDEGIALYQSIIDFAAPVLNASKTIERVRP
jgi:hypothetical protein